MKDSWQKIYSNAFEHEVEIVRAVLDDAGINSVVMNKKDSVYLVGEIELYVQADDVMRARKIIEKESL